MLSDDELAGMRAASEAAMPDVMRITRGSSEMVLDPDTGILAPADPEVVYQGRGRLRPPNTTEVEVLFGDEQVNKQRYVLTAPWDSPEILIDDRVSVVQCSDPHIGGRSFRVVAVSGGSFLLDRRCGLEVVE